MLMLGAPIAGATIGIVGAGRIGATMARRCHGLGMEVLYHSRSAKPDLEADTGAKRVEMDELLAQSDVVSLHVPLTEDTRYLLNRERLALMKPTAILVNTARGPVVEEQALIDALRDGAIEQSNFHDLPVIRMHEAPEIEVHLVDSAEPPTGVGEPGVPPTFAALANAAFAATGQRLRSLPLTLA